MNMQLLNLIIQPLLGAAAGYITNEYAINMLFKTYTPLKLGGVIPKTREAFIENVSTLVEEDIINKEKVEAILNDEAFTKNFDNLIQDFFTNSIYEVTDNLSIGDNPFMDKALSDTENFVNKQLELKLPELIESLTKQVKLCELLDKNQINLVIEKLYSYLLNVLKDTKLADKLVKNVIDKNENISLMDIIGYDNSAVISQNISNLLVNNLDSSKPIIDEILEKSDVSKLLFDFFEKLINKNESKLHTRVLSIFDSIVKSDEFSEVLFEFSHNIIEYFKYIDIPLLSLVDASCINKFKDILHREYRNLSHVLLSFITSNKSELQSMIEEAINDTINEQDAAKKAVLSMAKGSILDSIAKNDMSTLASEYFHDSNNKLNLCALASAKLKEYLKATQVSQAINLLEKKELLSTEALNEFLLSYVADNTDSIVNIMLSYIKKQASDEAFKKDIMNKLKNAFVDKFILSNQTTDFINNQLSIYLTKMFDTKLRDIIIAYFNNTSNITDAPDYESLSHTDINYNDYIYNYLEQNKDKLISTLSSNIDNAIQGKSINDILNDDLSNKVNSLSCNFAYEKTSEIKEDLSQEKIHSLYDRLNNVDNLHKNCSQQLRTGVINNLGSLLHGFVKGLSVKNLSQLDDENLIEMAQSFIGNNLKPIMIFGAMLGLIAGFILAFLQPNNNVFAIVSISGIITCALVGFLTNFIAIGMLFRPYKEIKILRRIPFFRHFSLGYIAKNTENLADGMSQAISDYLLTKESMNELIDTYKDSIKDSMINNVSKNDYQLLSDIIVNNKKNISSSISDYTMESLGNNKQKISTAIANEFENIKLNDLLLENEENSFGNNDNSSKIEESKKSSFETSISKYIINSRTYFSESIYNYLSERIGIDSAKAKSSDSGSLASILPNQLTDNISKLASSTAYKGYDGLINKLNYENIKSLAENYDKDYQKFIDKDLSEFFSIRKLLTLDNSLQTKSEFFKVINNAFSSQEKIGDIFNKKISTLLNNTLYNYFENIEFNSRKLLKPMHAHLYKVIKDKITSKQNLLAKISYGMMGGDKIVDSVVEKILSDKLPKLLANKKTALYDSCSNYLNTKLLNISISEFGMSLNLDTITDSELRNIKKAISPAIDFIDKKFACIKVRSLVEPLYLDNMEIMFSSYSKEISDLIERLSSKLIANKDELLSSFSTFIDSFFNETIKNASLKLMFQNIDSKEFKNISEKLVDLIFEESLVGKNVHEALSYIKNYDKKLYLSELVEKDELIERFEQVIENLSGSNNIVNDKISENYEMTSEDDSHNSIKLAYTRIIDDILISATENGFAFINNESKIYLLNQISDAVILSLRNNLSTMLNDIEFDKIAKEQIGEMSPKKIHMMFNSFAGKYFKTLILYGFWGAVFGINTVLGLALAGIYTIKNIFRNKVS
jgi:uncharacterized membrane protein YheB (UPF0754 family)